MAFITTAALISAGASLIGGAMASNAQGKAAKAQQQSASDQLALQKEMFNKQIELQAPFRQAGLTAENRLLDVLGLSGNKSAAGYGSANQNFTPSNLTTDPGYQFRLSEGLKALDQQAAARGGLISGNALKASQNYGQNAASQEYQNAYNRYQTNRANLLNPLQSLAGGAQSSANTIGNAAQNYANTGTGSLQYGGNAAASGYLGQANTWNQALNNVGSAYGNYANNNMLYNMLNNSGAPNPYNATNLSYAASGYPLPPVQYP
jgi:hypothetical protein